MATPMRAFRCDDDPWEPALARAQREGTTVTAVLVERLQQYAHQPAVPAPEEE